MEERNDDKVWEEGRGEREYTIVCEREREERSEEEEEEEEGPCPLALV